MKKFLMFAGILAFMSCSSDDSNSPIDPVDPVVPGPEIPTSKKNILVVGYDAKTDKDYLAQLNTVTGEIFDLGIENAGFDLPEYDEVTKKLYGLTQDQIITLDFNTKKLSKKEFSPSFVVGIDGDVLLDGKGNIITYFYRGYEFANYSSFYKINIETATNKIDNSSQKLNALLTTEKKTIFNYVLSNKKDKLYAQLREDLGQGKAKYSLLLLNPNDLEDYDENTEQKTIALPASFGNDMNGYGFFFDRDDNMIFLTSDDRLVQFDVKTGKESELYKFENTFVGDLAYDKTTNSIYYLLVDTVKEDEDSKYTKLVTVNLGNKAKKTIDLKIKDQGVLELTAFIMVDPF